VTGLCGITFDPEVHETIWTFEIDRKASKTQEMQPVGGGRKSGKIKNFFPKIAVATHGYKLVSDCGNEF